MSTCRETEPKACGGACVVQIEKEEDKTHDKIDGVAITTTYWFTQNVTERNDGRLV